MTEETIETNSEQSVNEEQITEPTQEPSFSNEDEGREVDSSEDTQEEKEEETEGEKLEEMTEEELMKVEMPEGCSVVLFEDGVAIKVNDKKSRGFHKLSRTQAMKLSLMLYGCAEDCK